MRHLALATLALLIAAAPAEARMMTDVAAEAMLIAPLCLEAGCEGIGQTSGTTDLLAMQMQQAREAAEAAGWWHAALPLAMLLLAWPLGLMVQRRGWKVGYTRKALALMLYAMPLVVVGLTGHEPAGWGPYVGTGGFLVALMLLSAPLRRRSRALATCFACIDRPEDRPFTLTWLITSTLATWAVMLAWLKLDPASAWQFVPVAVFVSGIGDALAEPVGLMIGRHRYRTRALGTSRTYVRTLEGSVTVFLSGVAGILIFVPAAAPAFALALLILPFAGALAEAKSPHTWDQPFIIAACWAAAALAGA